MAKAAEKTNVRAIDTIALLLALFYTQSVLTVAHHTSMWAHNGSSHVVEAPAVTILVVGLAMCGYSWYKKRSPSTLIIISLTILATASLFWLSGLRTNFYF